MQQYFSHIWNGTDVQADWRSCCTYGRAPNAIDILQDCLTCPSYTDTGPTFLYGDSDTPSLKSPSTTCWGYGGRILDLNPRRPHGGSKSEDARYRQKNGCGKTLLYPLSQNNQKRRQICTQAWYQGHFDSSKTSGLGLVVEHFIAFNNYLRQIL